MASVDMVVITVIERKSGQGIDVEVSSKLDAQTIARLLGSERIFNYGDVPHALYSTRLSRALGANESLADVGLWEGSELWVIPYALPEA